MKNPIKTLSRTLAVATVAGIMLSPLMGAEALAQVQCCSDSDCPSGYICQDAPLGPLSPGCSVTHANGLLSGTCWTYTSGPAPTPEPTPEMPAYLVLPFLMAAAAIALAVRKRYLVHKDAS